MRSMHNVLGGVIDPHAASLLLRGMKTLGLRVDAQNRTALEVRRLFLRGASGGVCRAFQGRGVIQKVTTILLASLPHK